MDTSLSKLRSEITKLASNTSFIHHEWFATWHLEIVEQIALELADYYPQANRNMVIAMVWMHDYAKIIDYNRQHDDDLVKQGASVLMGLGFDGTFAKQVADNIKIMDSKHELEKSNIEVQIVSSADGCSHLVGPFFKLYWREHPQMSVQDLLAENRRKLTVDWAQKVTLPEAKRAFKVRYKLAMEQTERPMDRYVNQ